MSWSRNYAPSSTTCGKIVIIGAAPSKRATAASAPNATERNHARAPGETGSNRNIPRRAAVTISPRLAMDAGDGVIAARKVATVTFVSQKSLT
jgi:hypothetical protein